MSNRTDLVLRRATRRVHNVRVISLAKPAAHVGDDIANAGTGIIVGLFVLPIILVALFLNSAHKA